MAAPKSRCKVRLAADPSIGVADLLHCVIKYLEGVGDHHLWKRLQPPQGVHWKSTPNPSWLAELAPLWKEYLGCAPNGLIPAKKNRTALQKLQEQKAVNTTKKDPEEWAEKTDEWIRIGLAHLRILRQNDLTCQRCLRKADQSEIQALQDVLDMLPDFDGPSFAAEGESQSTAMVPYSGPSPSTTSREDEGLASRSSLASSASPTLVLDPGQIFKKALNRPGIQDAPDEMPQSSRSSKQSPRKQKPLFSPEKFQPFLNGLLEVGHIDDDELMRLQEVQLQSPINKGYKSQLQKANQALKKRQAEEDIEQGEDIAKSKTGGKACRKGKKLGGKKVQKPKPETSSKSVSKKGVETKVEKGEKKKIKKKSGKNKSCRDHENHDGQDEKFADMNQEQNDDD